MIYHPVLFGEAYQQRQQRLLKPGDFLREAEERADKVTHALAASYVIMITELRRGPTVD